MITRFIRGLYRVVPAWQPTVAVTVAILFITIAPAPMGEDPIELFEGADKVIHGIMFAALAGTIALDRFMSGHLDKAKGLAIIAFITALFGGLTEILQATTGLGRSGDASDLAADAVGAIAGIMIFLWVRKGLRRNRA